MPIPFLTACWSHVCLLTYAVSPDLLRRRLPQGLVLDTRDGLAFVSLVAFDFRRTCLLGVPWPRYPNFAELNLRFYVRHGATRGVVFVREFVPGRLVAWLARVLYNEPYLTAPLVSTIRNEPETVAVEFRLTWAGRAFTIAVTGRKPAVCPDEDSDDCFFKEHQWGFGMTRRGRTLRYEVRHALWDVYPVIFHQLDFDWAGVYGPEWAGLQDATPYSVILAAGSDVAIFPKGRLGRG